MSLDVYLTIPGTKAERTGSGIFVRDGGSNVEISREEWDRRNPGVEPSVVICAGWDEDSNEGSDDVFHRNITHNLGKMANAAGIYEAMWRPEEIGISKASQLVKPLSDGLLKLAMHPDEFEEYNPSNGWGDYDGLVAFVMAYLAACVKYPDADVYASR